MDLREAIAGCSTGQVEGLSQQIIDRLLKKGFLAPLKHELIICSGRQNNPYLQPLAVRSLIKAVESANSKLIINSCLRTVPQQYMLYQQYLNKICGITAAALPGRSNHQSGLAIDVTDYKYWKPILERHGWRWLGNWDRWHFDYTHGSNLGLGSIQIEEFQQLWNENNPNDLLKVDGIWGDATANAVAVSPANGFRSFPIFKKGDISKEVGRLQIALRKALDLDADRLIADCQYGSQTFKAVALFQKKYGLKVDGIAGRETLSKLKEILATN